MVGSMDGLKKFGDKGYEVVMLTSRKSYLRKITINWIKRWGYFSLYNKFYFNNTFIGAADSKVLNVGKVKPEIHIDDSWVTICKLADNYPQMELWYLGDKQDSGLYKNIRQFKSWLEMTKKI